MKTPLLTVRDYLRMIFRRKVALFVPIVFGILMVAPLWLLVPVKYRASSLVRRKDLAVIRAASPELVGRQMHEVISVNNLKIEILSWSNLDKVIKQLKMDVDLKTPAQWQNKYEELKRSITIKSVGEGKGIDLVEISADSNYPPLAQRLANAIADNYVEEMQRRRRQDTDASVRFFRTTTTESLEKLRRTETEIEKYQQRHLNELPEVRKQILTQIAAAQTAENARALELSAAQNRLAEIEKQLAATPATVSGITETQPNAARVELLARRLKLQKELDAMLLQVTTEHPQVKKAQAEIAMIDEQVKEMPERLAGKQTDVPNPVYEQLMKDQMSVRQEIRSHEAALRAVRAQIAARQAEIRNVQDDERRYNDLLRQRAEYQEAYDLGRRSLLQAQQRLEVERGPYGAEVDMVARALEPTSPYRRDRTRMAFACLAGGLAIGIGLMFALEFADHSLRSADDAASFLNVPVLCTLSTLESPEDRARRRRRQFVIVLAAAGVVFLSAAGLVVAEIVHPGVLRAIVVFVRQILS